MKKYVIISLCFWMFFSSCNNWLDVKPQGQTEEEDMYTTYEGFKNALIGCYMKLKNRNLYGEKLTMSHVESLAQLWDLSASVRSADVALSQYDYENTYAKSAISTIYEKLYNVIVQTNSCTLSFGYFASFRSDASKCNQKSEIALCRGGFYQKSSLLS